MQYHGCRADAYWVLTRYRHGMRVRLSDANTDGTSNTGADAGSDAWAGDRALRHVPVLQHFFRQTNRTVLPRGVRAAVRACADHALEFAVKCK